MITVIVYGRNDGYGYGIDKRTAIGLNCLAESLTDQADEIIFVDYNTDDDLPTHPEAISDTLTPRARGLIRVIRVRPSHHDALAGEGLPVREAVARNIALRRARAENPWILSTNPDCILISPEGGLSAAAATLDPALYAMPRYELPRIIWEAAPRNEPGEILEMTRNAARDFALERPVRHYLPHVGFDSPGDFQLAPREDLIAIGGFDETMGYGWHVDSNLNARMSHRLGPPRALTEHADPSFRLFHCEHTRRHSPKHAVRRKEDSFADYVERVETPKAKHDANAWGAPEVEFETFSLADRTPTKPVAGAQAAPMEPMIYGPESHGRLPVDETRVAAFLADALTHLPSGASVATIGAGGEATTLAAQLTPHLKWIGGDEPGALRTSDAVVWRAPQDRAAAGAEAAERRLLDFVEIERAEPSRQRPVIGVNVAHGPYEAAFLSLIDGALAPLLTGLRQGRVRPPAPPPEDLIAELTIGPAGRGGGRGPETEIDVEGYLVYGPWLKLDPGPYELAIELDADSFGANRPAVLEAAIGGEAAASLPISPGRTGVFEASLTFTAGREAVFGGGFEMRLWSGGETWFRLQRASLTRAG